MICITLLTIAGENLYIRPSIQINVISNINDHIYVIYDYNPSSQTVKGFMDTNNHWRSIFKQCEDFCMRAPKDIFMNIPIPYVRTHIFLTISKLTKVKQFF